MAEPAPVVLCMCGRPIPPAGAKGGRPRQHCCRECGLADHHLNQIERWVMGTLPEMPPEAQATIRQRLWLIGNQLRPRSGRQSGTSYWHLELACGHEVDTKARSRQVDGESVRDPHPVRTRCATCGATQPVTAAELRLIA